MLKWPRTRLTDRPLTDRLRRVCHHCAVSNHAVHVLRSMISLVSFLSCCCWMMHQNSGDERWLWIKRATVLYCTTETQSSSFVLLMMAFLPSLCLAVLTCEINWITNFSRGTILLNRTTIPCMVWLPRCCLRQSYSIVGEWSCGLEVLLPLCRQWMSKKRSSFRYEWQA